MDFTGKRVLLVGGGRGIGRATALKLANAGAKAVVADIDLESAADTVALMKKAGVAAFARQVDATNEEACRELVADAVVNLGGLDTLISVVGWSDTTMFVDETSDYWEKIIAINLKSCIYLSHAAIPAIREAGGGAIVLTSSDAGKVGTKGETVYAAAKAGVIGFVKSLAREVSRDGIRVNAVAPGPTDTPLLSQQADQHIISRMVAAVPMKRTGRPEEQADALLYFASDRSSYVTGQTLSVSGGLTMSS